MSSTIPVKVKKKEDDPEQIRNDIIDLALEWRTDWCDSEDEIEAYKDPMCLCPLCELLRKCDEYIAICNELYKDEI